MAEVAKRRWVARSVAVLVVGMMAGSVMLTPVGAHITTFNHLKTKHFFTKKAADARFVNVGETAASAANAEKVDGLDANQLARASYAATADHVDDFSAATFTSIVSKTVAAPTGGVLLIWATLNNQWDANSPANSFAGLEARLTVDGTAVPGYDILPVRDDVYDETDPTTFGGTTESTVLMGGVAVTAANHTVSADLRRTAGTALTHVERAYLNVLFVPFGTAGTQGLLSAAQAPKIRDFSSRQ